MKLNIKLSLMVIAIITVVVTGIAIMLLSEASDISIDLSLRGIDYLAAEKATYWEGRENGHIRVLRTLANIMADYEDMAPEIRRNQFDNMLLGTFTSEPDWMIIYTVWKPNAVDGRDSQNIGRIGSTPTGQYAMTYTRETGEIRGRSKLDIPSYIEWLNGPNARRDKIEHPTTMMVNGRNSYVFEVAVPIINTRTREAVGAVGMMLSIDQIQPTLQDTLKQHDEISVMAIYAGNGFILGHFLPDRVGKKLIDVDVEYGKNRQAASEAVHAGEPYADKVFDPGLNTYIDLTMVPFKLGNSDTTWSVMIGTTESHILNEVHKITRFTVILAVIVIVLVSVVVFVVFTFVTKPIVRVTETLKDIAEGEGDLTRTISIHSKDEIGSLAQYFNMTLDKIKKLVVSIKKEAVKLSDIGNDLASNMNETAAAVNEITANIQSIKTRVMNQSASVSETHATMEQVTVNINKLNNHVEEQSMYVSQASSAIEQMVANVQSVTTTVVNNAANVKNLKEATEVGRTGLHAVSSDIQEIARESEGLLQINSVMENIASQTNLLSMNAAIEAAHAGESGKGFAVVAAEIRKLAESSSEQSKTIGTVLKKIKESIDKITRSTGNVLNKFEAIDTNIKTVSQQEDTIRNAMEEQGEGSKQVLNGVGNINEITRQVKSGSHEMLQGAKEVIQESNNLERVTQEITSGMNEMASGAEQINVAVNQVNEITVKNREGIAVLIKEVSRFKVE
ncbi:MAG: methyl-accepting chemotaxis protein [Treponema sp.]|nr:methyl-accepting chemotaxis protein [Treponema sp.]